MLHDLIRLGVDLLTTPRDTKAERAASAIGGTAVMALAAYIVIKSGGSATLLL